MLYSDWIVICIQYIFCWFFFVHIMFNNLHCPSIYCILANLDPWLLLCVSQSLWASVAMRSWLIHQFTFLLQIIRYESDLDQRWTTCHTTKSGPKYYSLKQCSYLYFYLPFCCMADCWHRHCLWWHQYFRWDCTVVGRTSWGRCELYSSTNSLWGLLPLS